MGLSDPFVSYKEKSVLTLVPGVNTIKLSYELMNGPNKKEDLAFPVYSNV